MAIQVSNVLNVAFSYPIVSCGLLLLLIFPVFQLFVYFFPLFISTALCVAALVTLGPSLQSDEATTSTSQEKEDKSLLSRLRCLQERCRTWIESKFKIKDRSNGLPDEDQDLPNACDAPDSTDAEETEHEKRVHQLERTLRTLSFVSYEGIFASDGTLLDMDDPDFARSSEENVDMDGQEVENEAPPPSEHVNGKAELADSTTNTVVPADPPAEPGKDPARGPPREQEENLSDTGSQDSASWQEVEHSEFTQKDHS